jgi:hypothetical protein
MEEVGELAKVGDSRARRRQDNCGRRSSGERLTEDQARLGGVRGSRG